MTQTRGPATVRGELYEVRRLEAVDRLERHPVNYVRRRVVVKQGSRRMRVWTYFIQPPFLRELRRRGRIHRALAGVWTTAPGPGAGA